MDRYPRLTLRSFVSPRAATAPLAYQSPSFSDHAAPMACMGCRMTRTAGYCTVTPGALE